MRTNKELLKLMLDNIDSFELGLCQLANILRYGGDMTMVEYESVMYYIYYNRPTIKSKLADKSRLDAAYFWPVGIKEPRERWLKYHVRVCKS